MGFEEIEKIDAEIKEVVDGGKFDNAVNHDNALFSLAVDIMAGYYVDDDNNVVCKKIKRKGKIVH